jgi:hypothetical protein
MPRPPAAGALSAALAFGWRGMLKVKHVPEQLVNATITPVMFVLMFTYLFGGAIAGSTASTWITSSPASWCCRCCSPPCTPGWRSTPT